MNYFEINIPLSIFKEGKLFVAYTPVLDLSTAAKTYDQAKERFSEAVNLFFEELVDKGTLDEVMKELGWRKVKKQWAPPVVVSHSPERIKIAA